LTDVDVMCKISIIVYMEEGPMSRLQLAINVEDLDAAQAFYTKLLGTPPAKTKPGYVNFSVADPPLKLILFKGPAGTINHLGIEVPTSDEVSAATKRLSEAGLATDVEEHVDCCYAVQDKVWVSDPDGSRWEVYTVLEDTAEAQNCGTDGVCVSTSDKACC
jgi:catechol 2,3-dioxygenase-like lactoylglutathione lyase family enzyme